MLFNLELNNRNIEISNFFREFHIIYLFRYTLLQKRDLQPHREFNPDLSIHYLKAYTQPAMDIKNKIEMRT
jgi:hypothetical protein